MHQEIFWRRALWNDYKVISRNSWDNGSEIVIKDEYASLHKWTYRFLLYDILKEAVFPALIGDVSEKV